MTVPTEERIESLPARGPTLMWFVLSLVGLKLGIHLFTNIITPYEFHRDEFLYFAMGEHLDLWRMDIPPAIAAFSQIVRAVFGDSLLAIRMVPAVFGGGTVLLVCLMVRELGGGRWAVGLAGACVLANVLFLRAGNLFQPVALDQFAWVLGFYALARLQREDRLRWWVLLGVGTGFGLLSKLTIGVFGVAVMGGLFLTRRLSWLAKPGPWIALATATLLGLPSLVGQITLEFPVLGYMAELQENQLARMTVGSFLGEQVMMMGPGALVGVVGVGFLLLHRTMKPFRILGWVLAFTLLLMIVLRAKAYYLGPAYPLAFAAGAIAFGTIPAPRLRGVVQWCTLGLVLAYGVLTLPLGLPFLPPPQMEVYAARLAGEEAVRTNIGDVERIPQDFADMLGWRDQVMAVAEVYHGLPEVDRERAVILASNYGEAGAIDFYGPVLGLPKAVAFVGTYWLYGPGDKAGDVVVSIGFSMEELDGFFAEVRPVRQLGHPFGVAEERNLTIHVARRPYRTLQEVWPELAGNN
jgi:4-amino-4-deoxy-L-arabinose transferase-like glycosyltransferase